MNNVVIFLDIDGVIFPNRQWYTKENRAVLNECTNTKDIVNQIALKKRLRFDPVALVMIETLAKLSNAKIVISSNWCKHTTKQEFKQIFKANKFDIELHKDTFTPKRMSSYRVNEIDWWLKDHPEVTNFVIFDDDWNMDPSKFKDCDIFGYLSKHIVWTVSDYGISSDDFKKACSILNLDVNEVQTFLFGKA